MFIITKVLKTKKNKKLITMTANVNFLTTTSYTFYKITITLLRVGGKGWHRVGVNYLHY